MKSVGANPGCRSQTIPRSSERDPGQVFALLEAVYRAMDKTARRYGVFKVETVADQYVAATGLPDPRDDHAVVMARFARATLVEVDELTMSLEASLGPGTGELCMRFGIHSGPITAGVLRSEKARFQLFGDTMNTSARMESTGENNKIQVTKEFVDELSKAGKLHWYSPRDELVTAKGKGQLQTYWLTLSSTSRSVMSGVSDTGEKEVTPPDGLVVLHDAEKGMTHSTSSNSVLTDDTDASKNSKKSVDYKVWCGKDSTIDFSTPLQLENNLVRLVDWNSEVLFVLLSKVCAHRKLVKKKTRPNFQYNKPSGDTIALDEVKEVVMLPEFDADAASKMATMDANVKLGPEVKSELRDFVGRVASSYQGNPFHNFEHASHVLLSASKLLTRILQPDAVVCKKSSDGHKDDKGKVVADALHQHTYGLSSDPLTQFAVVFSALIHDAGHTGVSNFQLAKEDPEVAIKYRNKSLAEQKSIDICWNILMAPCYDNLRRCIFVSTEERTLFRQLLVNSVMATDIFDKELGAIRTARWEKAFHSEEASVVGLDQSSEALSRKATIVIEHIIQASDVAHTMQHWSIYCKWNERLFQEQYNNFRSGRSDTDPSEKWFKGEIWFFDNYVIPLARKLEECGVFGVSSDEYLKYALENRAEWERNGGSITEKIMLKAQLLWQRDNNES
jgi:class 3 adenylate cyclase